MLLSFWDIMTIGLGLATLGVVAGGAFLTVKLIKAKRAKSKVEKADSATFEDAKENSALNEYHTIKNYDKIYNKKYSKLRKLKSVLTNRLENSDFICKESKYEKINKLKQLFADKVGIETDILSPDFTMERVVEEDGKSRIVEDRRTYIQIFDEDKAREFADFANEHPTEDLSVKPQVFACEFPVEFTKNNFIVSATDEKTYELGLTIIAETLEEYYATYKEQIFPLTFSNKPENEVRIIETYDQLFKSSEESEEEIDEEEEVEPETPIEPETTSDKSTATASEKGLSWVD